MKVFSVMPIESFLDDRLSKTDLRVLGAIVSFSDKNTGICWPKREQIATRCNLPLCKISTSTTHLVELGWLEKIGDGGRSRSVNYKVLIPHLNLETVTDSVTINEIKTVTDSVTKTVTDSVRGIKHTKEQTNITTKEKLKTMAKLTPEQKLAKDMSLEISFAKFYSIYPRKVAKPLALKAWKKLNPSDELVETIIKAVEIFKLSREWQQDDGKYIVHPSTFINAQRWEDEDIQNAVNKPQPKQRTYLN